MDAVSLAGTIGTWVAVFIAIVALVTIVGPLLVWVAARSDRSKALQAAGETDYSFVTKGFRYFSSDIRLFRRVRAPILTKEPDAAIIATVKWDISKYHDSRPRATWIQLAHLLRGYDVKFQRGDPLVIQNGKAFLPMHRVWILVIGLLGRYSVETKSRLTMPRNLSPGD